MSSGGAAAGQKILGIFSDFHFRRWERTYSLTLPLDDGGNAKREEEQTRGRAKEVNGAKGSSTDCGKSR